jgi:hypothetical protein
MMLMRQPVSSDARRTFWPPRPMAMARFSSSTTTSIAWRSSSTTMRLHVGRRQRADDELRRVFGPQHDVHALAGELVGDAVDARTAHADAGADGVDTAVVADDGDLGAAAGSRAQLLISSRPCSISGTSCANSSIMKPGALRDSMICGPRCVGSTPG